MAGIFDGAGSPKLGWYDSMINRKAKASQSAGPSDTSSQAIKAGGPGNQIHRSKRRWAITM
jgi:hypothetical protein